MKTHFFHDTRFPWDGTEMIRLDHLSRREFLQWTQKGLAGLFALALLDRLDGKGRVVAAQPSVPVTGRAGGSAAVERRIPYAAGVFSEESDAPEKGRVLDNTLPVYQRPSFSARLVKMYWRDVVLPINGATIGDHYPSYNRVWYRINDEGYAHSGKVQPVTVRYNQPLARVPEEGLLAEVTVPFTDALWDPNDTERLRRFAYRLYYKTVYWIQAVVLDLKGQTWYRVPDDKIKRAYYVNAEHLRPIPPEELAPISPHVPPSDKRLEVRLAEQVLVAYEGSRAVFMTRVASGGHFSDGDFSTPLGRYMTNRKRPSRHMASEDLAAPSAYDLPGVPWVSYLTKSGISFHGTYWHNDFGKPRSHGCVNLSPQAARWIYLWSNPAVPYAEHTWEKDEGTRVDVIK